MVQRLTTHSLIRLFDAAGIQQNRAPKIFTKIGTKATQLMHVSSSFYTSIEKSIIMSFKISCSIFFCSNHRRHRHRILRTALTPSHTMNPLKNVTFFYFYSFGFVWKKHKNFLDKNFIYPSCTHIHV